MRSTTYLLTAVLLFSSFFPFDKDDHYAPTLLLDGEVIYVNASATGNDDGSAWDDAFDDLQEALEVAQTGDSIWVATGIYVPTTEAGRSVSFSLVNEIIILGGFVGNETNVAERDWIAHPTILSGDIGLSGDPTDNSIHVITGQNLNSSTLLDGFIIEAGQADGGEFPGPEQFGGGLYLSESELRVHNCLFRGNNAQFRGGAVFFEHSLPRMQNCSFEGNRSIQDGGAIWVQYASENADNKPNFLNCTFTDNQARQGGAVKLFETNSISSFPLFFQECNFEGNGLFEAGFMTEGGAVFNQTSQAHRFEACIFTENFADRGGAVCNRYPEGLVRAGFYNCRFEENFTSITGSSGGGAVADGVNGPAETNYINCVFAKNIADHGGGFYYTQSSVSPRLINCIFDSNQGGGAYLDCANAYFDNCTFYNNYLPGIATLSCSAPIIENCIFWGNFFSNIGSFNNNPIFRRCLVPGEDCSDLDYAQCEDVIFGKDPLFINPDSSDFRLMICSPARDAGDASLLPLDVDTDIAGNQRVIDGQIDIGAHEFLDEAPQYRLTDVTRSDDSRQPRTLRSSMICVNTLAGPDTIHFFPGEAESLHIQPKSILPELLDDSTVIDASTHPLGTVLLDGSLAEDLPTGLVYGGLYIRGNRMEIYGLDIRNWPRAGIYLQNFSGYAQIGAPGKGNSVTNSLNSNTLVGNIYVGGSNHAIQSNYIGISPQGELQTIPSGGIALSVIPPILNNALIGGNRTLGEGNIIGGCSFGLASSDLVNNDNPFINIQVKGNYFGTDPTGQAFYPNGTGIFINSGQPWEDAAIGGSSEEANVFAHCEEIAIEVNGNSQQVYISRNSFYCNEEAIIIQPGANNDIQAPIIDTADVTYIAGTAIPGDSVQIFARDTTGCLPELSCQGKTYLGTVIADDEGLWSLDNFLVPLTGDEDVTALAIDTLRNTSEFSTCQPVLCPSSFGSLELSLCENESITVNGVIYDINNSQGIETLEGANAIGCDSILMIELRFLGHSETTLDLAACEGESVVIDDMVFSEAGQYEILLTNSNGCDSLVTLNLLITPNPLVDLGEDINIIPGEFYPLTALANVEIQHYEWSTGDTTEQISINMPGNYVVTVYDNNGCSATDEVIVTLVSSTNTQNEGISFDIVPNPASSKVWLHFSTNAIFSAELEVYDAKGQIVAKRKIDHYPGTALGIDLINYAAGVYIVRLRQDGMVWVKMLVVE